ncbi:MAG: chloride channel protein, partial [Acutalibacteraceae bacterium]|nr:chloride channel protein [Acutalibacteraceae bacterium]
MKISSEKISQLKKFTTDYVLILLASLIIGALCGVIGALFVKSINYVTELRSENNWLVYLLPLGGIVTVILYKLTHNEGVGTLKVFESVKGETRIPVLLLPVIFISTVITHLFGGSAGKEGAALQIGGAVSEAVSKITRADDCKRTVYTVCGMAALFSAAFGTPFGACVFALEVVFVKKTMLKAAIPALVSSLIANVVSVSLGAPQEKFEIGFLPDFGFAVFGKTLLVSAVVAAVSMIFCYLLHGSEKLFEKLLKNSYVRIIAGGCAVIILTLVFGTDYNGGGLGIIERIFEDGIVKPEWFLLKIIFTVITVSSGFKGGEIVPSLFIGSTLGGTLAQFSGLPVGYSAALGMIAFFSGVT